jgi:two-component system, NtrC family, sensor kinase
MKPIRRGRPDDTPIVQKTSPDPGERRAKSGSAERPLWWLLGASIVLPLLVFAVGSVISYHQNFLDAEDRLERTLGTVAEHATKVFETFEITAIYVDQLIGDVSNEEIRLAESRYHQRLKRLADTLPQLRDIFVIDPEGHPIVSGTIFPFPHALDLSDRDFYQAIKNSEKAEPYLSALIQSRAADRSLFLIARRRLFRGERMPFRGVVTTAIAPEYFSDYYARLPGAQNYTVGLVRKDGAILAWYPPLPASVRQLPSDGPLVTAMREGSRRIVTDVSPADEGEELFAFSRLPREGVYVLVGASTSGIIRQWAQAMSYHLLFGVPATLALIGLCWLALLQARRESFAYAQLREETQLRESTEQALRQAQKMEAVGRLTGGIAHDFNNLLTAIIGNTDLALRRLGTNDGRVERSLNAAKDAAQRAAALISRLLAFSRQQPHEVRLTDVNRLVRDMSELLSSTIGEAVTIETVLGAGLWRVALDPNELEAALLNLAVNSRDAMADGGRLTIETSNAYLDEDYITKEGADSPAGQYVLIAVSDTGSGMSPEVIEQAFEPFFTTKPKGIGTGLGLSMVYGFVKQSAGHVKIYSEVGHGTTVKMYFPRVLEQRDGAAAAAATRTDQAPRGAGQETILLVEDDDTVNRFAAEVLQDLGYVVISAAEASRALTLLDENDIDLLFTDVVLPGGMNGRDLANEAVKKKPGIKVLFATGYTRNAIIHHGRLDPGVDVLMKPYTYEVLARKIRAVLDNQQPAP